MFSDLIYGNKVTFILRNAKKEPWNSKDDQGQNDFDG